MKFVDNIGDVVKEARTKQHITLKEVSEATGISIGFLSQFERGICNISLDSLSKIAGALSISVEAFFLRDDPVSSEGYRVFRSYELSPSQVTGHSVQYYLANTQKPSFLPRLQILFPQAFIDKEKIAVYSHEGEEFVWVLEGILTLFIGEQKEALYPGDSVYLKSGLAHNWLNLSNNIVKVLTINYPNPLDGSKLGETVPL